MRQACPSLADCAEVGHPLRLVDADQRAEPHSVTIFQPKHGCLMVIHECSALTAEVDNASTPEIIANDDRVLS